MTCAKDKISDHLFNIMLEQQNMNFNNEPEHQQALL